jgi:hypothetical protein
MSVQIASLNYSAHVWSPASTCRGDLDGFQGILGVGVPVRGSADPVSGVPSPQRRGYSAGASYRDRETNQITHLAQLS